MERVKMVANRQTTGDYGSKIGGDEFETDSDTAKALEKAGAARRAGSKPEKVEAKDNKSYADRAAVPVAAKSGADDAAKKAEQTAGMLKAAQPVENKATGPVHNKAK